MKLKFELGRLTVHLLTKFHHRSGFIMLTNAHTNKLRDSESAENILHLALLLCYAGVDKWFGSVWFSTVSQMLLLFCWCIVTMTSHVI